MVIIIILVTVIVIMMIINQRALPKNIYSVLGTIIIIFFQNKQGIFLPGALKFIPQAEIIIIFIIVFLYTVILHVCSWLRLVFEK